MADKMRWSFETGIPGVSFCSAIFWNRIFNKAFQRINSLFYASARSPMPPPTVIKKHPSPHPPIVASRAAARLMKFFLKQQILRSANVT